MSFAIKGEIPGAAAVVKRLASLNSALRKRILKKGINAGGRIVRKAVRARTPTRGILFGNLVALKLLRKSIKLKVRVYGGGERVVAIIGPVRGMKTQIGTISRGPNKGKPIYEDPANIGHLVEFGHGGPHPAPAHSFARAGWDASAREAGAAVARVITEEISKELGSGAA